MTARLNRFRITNFRSIVDSDWITTEEVTALIGVNESGKTNLLTALWKLKPAKGGSIHLLDDLPRKRYHKLRKADPMPTFATAEFTLDDATVDDICARTKCTPAEVRMVRVTRRFDDVHTIEFPNEHTTRTAPTENLLQILDKLAADIDAAPELRGESGLKASISTETVALRKGLSSKEEIDRSRPSAVLSRLKSLLPSKPLKTSALVAALHRSLTACHTLAVRPLAKIN